jgi:hypothetical protein
MREISLSELTDGYSLALEIEGQKYRFGELSIAALGRLQTFIERELPDPFQAMKAKLDGLEPEDRRYLLNEARKESLNWPPNIQSREGKLAILAGERGQIEVLYECFQVHHQEMTKDRVRSLYQRMLRQVEFESRRARKEKREYNGESDIQRIYAAGLGLILPSEEDPNVPKCESLPKNNGSTGGSYSEHASKDSK